MSPISYTWEVREYAAKDGRHPFTAWVQSLPDARTRARVAARINRLRLGNFGDAKPVGGGVMELRIHAGKGVRVYFARIGERVVLLLAGGDKSTQRRDIERAKEYWQDYRRRHEGKQTL